MNENMGNGANWIQSPPAPGNGAAASGVRVDGSPGPVAVVGVVGPPRPRRAWDPVGSESPVGDVIAHPLPEQRSPGALS